MRFIHPKFAPMVTGLIIMLIMMNGLPFIVLWQNMPISNPEFFSMWWSMVRSVAPYGVPLAFTAAFLARLCVGFLVLKPKSQ